MDSSQIELKGSHIAAVERSAGSLRLRFGRALIVKSMTGSRERTRWWQAGSLLFEGATTVPELPQGAQICAGGDLEDNIYTYRDMIPIPFESRGRIRCVLQLEGQAAPLTIEAGAVRLELDAVPKYIEHIRP